jgi:hypothetical protein
MKRLLARAASPIVWRIPGHGAKKLFGFALAEHASRLDLEAAVRRTPSPARRAAYLRHLLDEARHAQMFTLRSAELRRQEGREPLGDPRAADIEDLFENLGEARFLAFVHLGERRGRQQFAVYRDWFDARGDARSRALFDAIMKDEREHESYTWDLLVEVSGSAAAARRALRRAALWEAWRTWRRLGRFVAEGVYFVTMLAVYVASAPLALLVRAARPLKTGWVRPAHERDA